MPHSLIVGGDGLIGSVLRERLRGQGHAVTATSRRALEARTSDSPDDSVLALDLSFPPDVAGLGLDGVEVAYLCAAATSLQACRQDWESTYRVNVEHTALLAEQLLCRGIDVIYLSSNHVFNGEHPLALPGDYLAPVTAYGRQKAEIESRLIAAVSRSSSDALLTIVRFGKVLPSLLSQMPLFLQWKRTLLADQAITPFSDLSMAPLPVDFACDVLTSVPGVAKRSERCSIWHATGDQSVGYVRIANQLAASLGKVELVQPTTTRDAGVEPFGPHTTLDSSATWTAMNQLGHDIGRATCSWGVIEALLDQDVGGGRHAS